MSTHPIHVFSEIGKLKKVMLHRPGKELENLMPDHLERLLFDDIPFLEDAQKEHDAFADALRKEGIEVLYLEKLAAESLTSPEIRNEFIEEYLDEADFPDLKFTRSSPFAADIVNQGMSKLEGIKLVGKEYGFDINQVMAFGDSDNDVEMLAGVGMSIAMGNGTSRVKEVAKHTTSSNSQDGIHKALEHFGILASEKVFISSDHHFNKVKEFHGTMDECTQEEPILWTPEGARHRAGFKVEELVEFLRAASPSEEVFEQSVQSLHEAVNKAAEKVKKKSKAEMSLVGQVDALIDMLYFTYGSFVLMGVDPEYLFEIVHRANMGKLFPDGKAHFDPITHKILKPDDWEENYAPEPAIKKELERQIQAYQRNCTKNVE